MVTAIIVGAGSSRRMGTDKLFASLCGRPVIAHSIAAFNELAEISDIILVTRKDRIPEMQSMVDREGFNKVKRIVAGGEERHHSVWNGIQAVDDDCRWIAIHDGARPLVTPKNIDECLELARKEGAACLASPISDTLKRANIEQAVTESVDRSGLWGMQTPQIFSRDLIFEAYTSVMAQDQKVTDEVSAVQGLGKKILLLHNKDWNFKITYSRDLELAEQVLKLRCEKVLHGK